MERKSIRISFIIPAYNVGDYIGECINSLLSLPLDKSEYEIIIVNDGSTDNTLSVCFEFKKKHANIVIINNENNGVSFSRNCGIDAAKGKYVCFVDGDDFHYNEGIVNLLTLSEKNNLDIARGKYFSYIDGRFSKNNLHNSPFYYKVLSGKGFLKNTIKYKENEVVPWLGLFKRDFLIVNNISFNESIGYEEDQIYFLSCLLAQNCSIMQTNDYFYVYRYRESSATKTTTLKQAEDVAKVVKLEEFLIKKNKESATKRYARKFQSSSFYQLTSIYGRVDKRYRKKISQLVPLRIKIKCLIYAYDSHQRLKIFLFTFMRWIVNLVYSIKRI